MTNRDLITTLRVTGKIKDDQYEYSFKKAIFDIETINDEEICEKFLKLEKLGLSIEDILILLDELVIMRDYSDDFVNKLIGILEILKKTVVKYNNWKYIIKNIICILEDYDNDEGELRKGVVRYLKHNGNESDILKCMRVLPYTLSLNNIITKDRVYEKRLDVSNTYKVQVILTNNGKQYIDVKGITLNKNCEIKLYFDDTLDNITDEDVVIMDFREIL